jgi:NAD(P)H-dependent FMN reductase
MLLDQEYDAYAGKPVAICTVSRGGFGGVRVFENLLPVLHYLGLHVLRDPIYVSKVDEFSEDSAKVDDKFKEHVNRIADEMLTFSVGEKFA